MEIRCRPSALLCFFVSLALGRSATALQLDCAQEWAPTFGDPPGADGSVGDMLAFDDGSGPALFVIGGFSRIAGVPLSGIAKWDGSSWSGVGSGMSGTVLAVYDDGSGPALFADRGYQGLAKWDGATWSLLGFGGFSQYGQTITALTVYDDGSGPALHVAGYDTQASGQAIGWIRKWNGSSWSTVGVPAIYGTARAPAVYDDGGGPELYIGGNFVSPANRIFRWDGSSWSPVGSGLSDCVHAMAVFAEGGGSVLFVGGEFGASKWDGSSWSPEGGTHVVELSVCDDGSGPALFAGRVDGIGKRVNSSWAPLASNVDGTTYALAGFDDGSGPALFAGGGFTFAGSILANRIAKWDGASWTELGDAKGLNGNVYALAIHDDGSGPSLYAAGAFTSAGPGAANRIAKWNGSSWSPLGSGLDASVSALAVYDRGTGPALYAGGAFTSAGGVTARGLARWNGASWSAAGAGANTSVYALAVHDDGSGPSLYIGGTFAHPGGANNIARWNGDGAGWYAVGTGTNGGVYSLTVYDDGGGPALYAGGTFTTAGGVAANRIAKWDGASWSPLGNGISGSGTPRVSALAVFDDGSGAKLIAGGNMNFAVPGGNARGVASWDGSSWSRLGAGLLSGPSNGYAYTLAVYDDGSGPALHAGGVFTGGNLARWNGTSWSALGSGPGGYVHALAPASRDDVGGPSLFVGGTFDNPLDIRDSFLARWGCALVDFPHKTRRR